MTRPSNLRRTAAAIAGPTATLLVLASCDQPTEPEDPTPLEAVYREWAIWKHTNDEDFSEVVELDRQQSNVPLTLDVELGAEPSSLPFSLILSDDSVATAEIFSSETGMTYWVSVEAPGPNGLHAPDSAVGGEVQYTQAWRFRKDSPNAALRFVVSLIVLEAYDGNGLGPSPEQCTWSWWAEPTAYDTVCENLMRAWVDVSYHIGPDPEATPGSSPAPSFWSASGRVLIRGWGDTFRHEVTGGFGSSRRLFRSSDFYFVPESGPDRHHRAVSALPITVDIPLDSVDVGESFEVGTFVLAVARNRRQAESYAAAFFRDPAASTGVSMEYEGVTVLDPPAEFVPPPAAVAPAPACTSDGAGGTIQFEAASYLWPEWPGDEAEIMVTRAGGGAGAASVAFTTSGGTATAGSDYESLTTHVGFDDGEEGVRVVLVPIVADTLLEPNETVSLTLSSPSGCATLGGVTSAELTIMDDDHPPPDLDHTLGGTVSGLEGSGLVLTNNATDDLEITENGAFVFGREYPDGHVYNVRVHQQPTEPAQACGVVNGTGTVGGSDVTNIEVTCVTLPPPGDGLLDDTFGDGGVVTSDELGPVADFVFTSDGEILVLTEGTTGASLARFHPDGSLDETFGSGGVAPIQFNGAGNDVLRAMALQPDGKIVVVGETRVSVTSPTQEDFLVARFDANGVLDPTFAGDGWVALDLGGRGDAAHDVVIQPDGAIVVAGTATLELVEDLGTSHIAAVRFTPTGQIDGGFGTGGRATADVAGASEGALRINFGRAVALQPDGKIVVVGLVAASGGSQPDVALVRYNPDGSWDEDFGEEGVLRDESDGPDEPTGVVLQADGSIVVVGHTTGTLLLARYTPQGAVDSSFGAGGRNDTVPTAGTSVALQSDGSLIAAGWVAQSDFLIARFDADGQLDTGFGEDGTIRLDFFGGSDVANAVGVQPDGKIVVGGSISTGLQSRLGLVRVLP